MMIRLHSRRTAKPCPFKAFRAPLTPAVSTLARPSLNLCVFYRFPATGGRVPPWSDLQALLEMLARRLCGVSARRHSLSRRSLLCIFPLACPECSRRVAGRWPPVAAPNSFPYVPLAPRAVARGRKNLPAKSFHYVSYAKTGGYGALVIPRFNSKLPARRGGRPLHNPRAGWVSPSPTTEAATNACHSLFAGRRSLATASAILWSGYSANSLERPPLL